MKTLVVKKNKTVSILTMFAFFVLATFPALGTTEFEIGTRFGISHLAPDADDDSISTSITYANIPSAPAYVGASPTALYATWFPNQQFGIGPEFSFGRFSISEEYWGEKVDAGITAFHLGGRAAFFLLSHLESSPYVLGRVSTTIFSGDDIGFSDTENLTSFGIGFGYQWRIDAAFVFRAEAQYQRLLLSNENDDANEFSLIFGIGTRFGNSKSQNP